MGTGTVNPVSYPALEWRPAHDSNVMSRGGYEPECVVLHIAEGSYDGAAAWFATPAHQRPGGAGSAAHFTVAKDGRVARHVQNGMAAIANGQEAGAVAWVVKENPGVNANAVTLSIEHEGFSGHELTPPQWEASTRLTAALFFHVLLPSRVPGMAVDRNHIAPHRDFAPQTRARCPGWDEVYLDRYIDAVRGWLYAPAVPDGQPVGLTAAGALRLAVDDLTALAAGLDDLATRAAVQAQAARVAMERAAKWLR